MSLTWEKHDLTPNLQKIKWYLSMHVNVIDQMSRETQQLWLYFLRCLMAGISEINILSELCIATKPAIVTLDKVKSKSWKLQQSISLLLSLKSQPSRTPEGWKWHKQRNNNYIFSCRWRSTMLSTIWEGGCGTRFDICLFVWKIPRESIDIYISLLCLSTFSFASIVFVCLFGLFICLFFCLFVCLFVCFC